MDSPLVFLQVITHKTDGIRSKITGSFVQKTRYDFFSIYSRKGVYTEVKLTLLILNIESSILWNTTFCNIHSTHDFQAGNNGVLKVLGDRQNLTEHTVNTHAHLKLFFLWLNVYITGTLQNGTLDNGVYQTDGWCIVDVVVEDVSCKLRFFAIVLFGWSLTLHGLNSPCGAFVSVKDQDGMLHALCGSNHRNNLFTDCFLNFLDRIEVHRVAHGQIKLVPLHADRHYLELFRNVFRNNLCHGNGNGGFRKIYVFNTQLKTKCLDQLCLCDDSC